MNDYKHLIYQNAREKAAAMLRVRGERDRIVHLDEYAYHEHGIENVRLLPKPELRKLYLEYQDRMVEMHFLEWDCAGYWGLPKFLNLFGR